MGYNDRTRTPGERFLDAHGVNGIGVGLDIYQPGLCPDTPRRKPECGTGVTGQNNLIPAPNTDCQEGKLKGYRPGAYGNPSPCPHEGRQPALKPLHIPALDEHARPHNPCHRLHIPLIKRGPGMRKDTHG
jgi:hypothetical protein